MCRMTLQTEKRHGGIEQRAIDRTMGLMTVHAVFRQIAMGIYERSLLFHMTAGAGFVRRPALEQLLLQRAVYIVAIGTDELFFPDRVMGRQIVLRLHFGMTAVTKIGHFFTGYLLRRSLVQFMTIGAGNIVQGMGAGIPVR